MYQLKVRLSVKLGEFGDQIFRPIDPIRLNWILKKNPIIY